MSITPLSCGSTNIIKAFIDVPKLFSCTPSIFSSRKKSFISIIPGIPIISHSSKGTLSAYATSSSRCSDVASLSTDNELTLFTKVTEILSINNLSESLLINSCNSFLTIPWRCCAG